MSGGRPVGSKNKSGHAAGGVRVGAGRKSRVKINPPDPVQHSSQSQPSEVQHSIREISGNSNSL
jgi:hypothetical protein